MIIVAIVKDSRTHPLYKKLVAIIGEDRVNDNRVSISLYSKDAGHLTPEKPGIIVMSETESDGGSSPTFRNLQDTTYRLL